MTMIEWRPEVLPFIILFFGAALEYLINWPERSHPTTLLRIAAIAIGKKVLPKSPDSVAQHRISGILAIFVLCFPLLLITVFVLVFAEYSFFFDALFLMIALRYQPVTRRARQIGLWLKQGKKQLARDQLKHMVLRQTDSLTELGLSKACIEAVLLRYCYQYTTVLFWYLLAGGVGALLYRFLYEMSQAWNIKQAAYRHFGRPVSWLCFYLQWIPVRLTAVLLMLVVNLKNAFRAIRGLKGGVSAHTLLLAICGGAIGIQLGGPAIYNGTKVRLPKCGGPRRAESGDIALALRIVQHGQIALLALLWLIMAIVYALA